MLLWLQASRACRAAAAEDEDSPKPWCRLPAMETRTASCVSDEDYNRMIGKGQ